MEKFCFVSSWSFHLSGGVNQVINNLEQELISDDKFGLKPLMLEVSWDLPEDWSKPLPSGTERAYLRLTSPFTSNRPLASVVRFLLALPGTLWKLKRLARREKVVVFNYHFPGLEAVNLILLRLTGLFRGKVVLSMHGSDIRAAHQESSPIAKSLWRWMLRNASAVVSCSKDLGDEVLLLEPKARVVTIYNGVDMARFQSSTDPVGAMPRLDGKKVIVNVGGFEFRKGHDILLRAFQRITDTRKDVALLLIGKSGPKSIDIKNFIHENGLEQAVVVLEDVPHKNVFQLLTRSDVFVLSTRWKKKVMGEGFALAILEAAAAGLPVVATASCGVQEIIFDGQTGFVTPLDDPEALAEAILRVIDEPDNASRMARSLHELVKEQFTWDKAAAQYVDLVKNDHYSDAFEHRAQATGDPSSLAEQFRSR